MKQKVKKNKKAKDDISILKKKYAKWKEKQEKNKFYDFEQYHLEGLEFLDFEDKF